VTVSSAASRTSGLASRNERARRSAKSIVEIDFHYR
jgi:hypothetical protein